MVMSANGFHSKTTELLTDIAVKRSGQRAAKVPNVAGISATN